MINNDNPLSDGVRDLYDGIQALGLLIVLNVHRISDFEGAATVPGTLRRHSHKPCVKHSAQGFRVRARHIHTGRWGQEG